MTKLLVSLAVTCLLTYATSRAEDKPVPAGGQSLLAENVEAQLKLGAPKDSAEMGLVPVKPHAGQPFSQAVRVRTIVRPQRDYEVQLIAPSVAAVTQGDVCLLRFWLRAADTTHESGEARARVYFQKASSDWHKIVDYAASAADQWKRFDVPFVAGRSYPAGQAALGVALGYKPQTVEIAGIRLLNFGRGAKLRDLPRTKQTYAGSEPDAAWRAEAEKRIDQHRKADLTVRVLDAEGKPLAGADVAVRMKRHAFGFGSAVVLYMVASPGEENDLYRKRIFELFNRVVNENDLKWPAWESQWGRPYSKEKSIAALKLLREKGFYVRGHCLVWPAWRHVPGELQKLKNDPAALRKAVREHIVEETTATKGLIDEWDVMNEPFSNHDLMDVCGKDVMVEWWKAARSVLPEARLYVNDYAILAAGGDTATAHQQHYEETIRYLLDQGAPLGGIGLQSHFRSPTPPETVWKLLDRFAKFNLPMSITEFDFPGDDEELQARYTRDFMTAVFAHPGVDGFVMWGFWEGRHWRPDCAMFRRDGSIKPNGEAYKELVFKRWWTDADGQTAADGAYKVRGFLGDYEVTVSSYSLRKTEAAKLDKPGSTLTVKFGGT